MAHELPKAYDPGAIESRWADYWVAEKLFSVQAPEEALGPTFSLLLPPPNVTGRLHMGHMLNQTEMDIIIRWQRMRGVTTLWLPGTDHAGIATQMMVERQIAAEGKKRQEMGREAFLERVWQWRQLYGGAILQQMRRLGASVDWDREYFTMDEKLSRAVREAFVVLHEQGLIYRGAYIVNWCPRCVTAISDLEVVHEEFHGKLYEIRYPVVGAENEFIVVATTRPETMLGDTAVAVNPNDERYRHLHGRKVRVPLLGREIPIVLDELADPAFGTGAVKVTPAHDPNDYNVGVRHSLPQINVMDDHARINQHGGPYQGLDRHEARQKVLEDLQAQGLLGSVKDHVYAIGKCDRCKTIVEPRLSTQWFLAVNKAANQGGASMAEKAIAAVESGEITFVPENYRKTYFEWMRNLHDWCISRQLWWGHRIPAWYCTSCREVTVARETPPVCKFCRHPELEQDQDVLDTWFSSALLPFSGFGWPEKTRDLEVFYPTSLLITGFDILFFWVARMIMMGCWFMEGHPSGAAPFRQVYIHSLVRDAERQKMSKTKGNVVDPIGVIEQYGTDAVRFTLASMAAPGTDIAFSESRTESYRSFANKIWNAARFLFMNVDRAEQAGVWSLSEFQTLGIKTEMAGERDQLDGLEPALLEDRWIVSRMNQVAREVHEALNGYRFHEAAHVVYHFFWGEFCDWYIEIAKLRMAFDGGGPAEERQRARVALSTTLRVFEAALRLLHPFMPFITEEIWHAIYDGNPPLKSIALSAYPLPDESKVDLAAEMEMSILQDLIVSVRNIRAELQVEQRLKAPIEVHAAPEVQALFARNRATIEKLASVDGVRFLDSPGELAKAAGARHTARFGVRVVYEKKIDEAAERERLGKELAKAEAQLANAERQLGNDGFLAKAPAKVVEGLRRNREELLQVIEKTRAALGSLAS